MLIASNSIVVRGAVHAKGLGSASGNGGGASAAGQSIGGAGGASVNGSCYSGASGGRGGAGAGGGVLLKATYVDTSLGMINTLGGGSCITNGGTLKIFFNEHQAGAYSAGRTYLKQLALPESGTFFEF
jgi:hypothetical protein